MNLEGITLHVLSEHLNRKISGGKIVKVAMPTPASVLLIIRKERENFPLLFSLEGGNSLLYRPEKLSENPFSPPAFCMLLRKHLEDGRINTVRQSGLDRVILLEIDLLAGARKIVTKVLICELTGRNGNLILASDGQIIDALRHIGHGANSYRQILPNRPYLPPPPQEGLSILNAPADQIARELLPDGNKSLRQKLIAATIGIGKFTADDLLLKNGLSPEASSLNEETADIFAKTLTHYQEEIKTVLLSSPPVYALSAPSGNVQTLLPVRPGASSDGKYTVKTFADYDAAVNYAVSVTPRASGPGEELARIITAAGTHQRKKMAALSQDLQTAQNAEEEKIKADTLMAYIYKVPERSSTLVLPSIYDDAPLTISLDPLRSPIENANTYYKRYGKLKRAVEEVQKQIEQTAKFLEYLQTLEQSIQTADTKNEWAEIRQELVQEGLLKAPGKKTPLAAGHSTPLIIKVSGDETIYIGKNNKQNDQVTFTLGKPTDLWFHVKDFPGSHVILKTLAKEPSADGLQLAAALAAYFSKARGSANIPVDYTLRRYVRKPSGAKPGFVIYTNQKTLHPTPDENAIKKLLND